MTCRRPSRRPRTRPSARSRTGSNGGIATQGATHPPRHSTSPWGTPGHRWGYSRLPSRGEQLGGYPHLGSPRSGSRPPHMDTQFGPSSLLSNIKIESLYHQFFYNDKSVLVTFLTLFRKFRNHPDSMQ